MRVLFNARIHTLDETRPAATALAIDQGRILALGDDDLRLDFGRDAQSQDLGGRTVIPGLTDAHIHLQHYALGLQKVDCEVPTKAECLKRISKRAANTPPGNWILGHGWNQNNWPDGFGNAADIDLAAPKNPVYLTAKSLHAGWANSEALKTARIDLNTPDPADGKIQRDEHGNPTGILLEGAMRLVAEVIPEPSETELAALLEKAQTTLWEMGITGVHDFDRQACFAALQILHGEERLKLRVLKSIPLEALPHAIEVGLRSGFGDEWLWIGGVKAFMDGALGPHTAAMLEPYEDDPDNQGMLLIDAEGLYEYGQKAAEHGLSMAVHAIGDRANHEAINAYEQLRKYENNRGIRGLRHRIEHVQILHPQDQRRLAELGIIASMQPIHATSDMLMADEFWGARAAQAYAWQTQLKQGAVLAFGSDAPVESPNPFWGLHAAVTRRRSDGTPGPAGWYPEQRLSIQEALRGYTTGPAYAAGMENNLGKLAPGYLADLLVLDTDPFACEPEAIKDIHPDATMVGGEWVFSAL
jgi:predicted amidohydrolase YtcJ